MLIRCRQLFGPLLLSVSILGLSAAGCGVDSDESPRRRPPPNNPGDNNPGDNNPGDNNPGDNNPGDNNPGDNNPGDNNPGDNNPGDANPPTATSVGDDCQLGTQANPEGSCDAGQACIDLYPNNNICTQVACQSDSQCGNNGSFSNKCLQIGLDQNNQPFNTCLRGCDPADSSTCGRDGFKCFGFTDGEVCIPDCRSPGNENICQQGSQCDATGQCRENGSLGYYDRCGGNNQGSCALSDVCVGISGAAAVCLTACNQLGQQDICPAGSVCAAELDSDTGLCLALCDPADPNSCGGVARCEPSGSVSLCIPN